MPLSAADQMEMNALAASMALRGGAPRARQRPALTGFNKVKTGVEAALRGRRFANPVALCRANESALKMSARERAGRRARIRLQNDGSSLVLDEGAEDKIVVKSPNDGAFWSAMSGFFRLFAIMATMPGEDVPRQALTDFLGVWSRIWDSSVGSHHQKIEAMERFYDENAATLGDGNWMKTLESDMPFWTESFRGSNLPTCAACSGAGDRARPRSWEGDDDADSPSGGRDYDRERSASPDDDRERSASPAHNRERSPSRQQRASGSEGEGDASPHERSPSRQSCAGENGSEEHESPRRSGAQSSSRSRDRSPSPWSRTCSRARNSSRAQSHNRHRARVSERSRSRSRSHERAVNYSRSRSRNRMRSARSAERGRSHRR